MAPALSSGSDRHGPAAVEYGVPWGAAGCAPPQRAGARSTSRGPAPASSRAGRKRSTEAERQGFRMVNVQHALRNSIHALVSPRIVPKTVKKEVASGAATPPPSDAA